VVVAEAHDNGAVHLLGRIVVTDQIKPGSAAAVAELHRLGLRVVLLTGELFLAFIYNALAIPLAAFGLLNPLIAAAAMALSDVTVIGNALLLRRSKIE